MLGKIQTFLPTRGWSSYKIPRSVILISLVDSWLVFRPTRGGEGGQGGSGSSFGKSQELRENEQIPETPSENIPETPAETPFSKMDASLQDDLASATPAIKVNRFDSEEN